MKTVLIGVWALALLGVCALAQKAPEIPKGNHYVCYPVSVEKFAQKTATFKDQFGKSAVTVLKPVMLCAPALKTFNGKDSPIIDEKLHMVCYAVKYDGKLPFAVLTNDQFGTLTLKPQTATTVCLPAGKTPIKQ